MENQTQSKFHKMIHRLDQAPLWLLVFPLMAVFFSYYLLLGENVYFEINDQLDETLFTYVLNAKYLFRGVSEYPELLGGVPTGGMMVSAWIFVPLYRVFSTFTAFMIQFAIVCITAYLGMYATVKELTQSSLLAAVIGGMFMFLPYQPVYGLSVVGGPMILYAFLLLYQAGNGNGISKRKLFGAYLLVLYFVLGAHLVLLGYVALGFAVLAGIVIAVRKTAKEHRQFYYGIGILLLAYVVINHDLFVELIIPNSGFVSHREEMIITGSGFASAWEMFLHSGQHAVSLHQYLIVPILAVMMIGAVCYRKMDTDAKRNYWMLCGIFLINVLVALFVGLCESELIINWRNSVSGFFHYFAAYRVYWIYPTTWYLAAALAMNQIRLWGIRKMPREVICWILIGGLLLPTAWNVRQNSNWILNKSQYKNNCNVGLMSWKEYFASDVMAQIKEAIGKDQTTYKVASLGICPALALEAGFYCIDGYSNNYSLDYKHAFREIISAELEKTPSMKAYFDDWGSRCYLFTEESQNYYYLAKGADFRYDTLELNTSAMKDLGCEYLFAGAEITNAEDMDLELLGRFSTSESYYEVWVYELR